MAKKPKIVFLGTYPPRECGIATFTQDLLQATQKIYGHKIQCLVAAFNISILDTHEYPEEVVWVIDQDNKLQHKELADEINQDSDIVGVYIQHEYGIYGGADGINILEFLKLCKKPKVLTLHTVLPSPNLAMRKTTVKLLGYSDIVVVLTQSSKSILENIYPQNIGKVQVIPHGIHHVVYSSSKKAKKNLKFEDKIVLTTFGMLSSSKGIEYVIKALPKVVKEFPNTLYLVLGATHPVARRLYGESYRLSLIRLIKKLKIVDNVKFYDKYFSLQSLLHYLQATDVYISTSLNPNQAVSGTFSYAVGTGRAIVATEFAQAKEVISPSIGKIVQMRNPEAYANAILELIHNPRKLKKMHKFAYRKTRSMLWSNVSVDYINLLMPKNIILPPINLSYLKQQTDEFGMFQFSKYNTPDKNSGYTIDDNARALVVCSMLSSQGYKKSMAKYLKLYLNFIQKSQLENGWFINYLDSVNYSSTTQNDEEQPQDHFGRVMWALSEIIANQNLSLQIRKNAIRIFENSEIHTKDLTHLRPKAHMIKAYYNLGQANRITELADDLVNSFEKNKGRNWQWFENNLTYANALLPEALIKAGSITNNSSYTKIGKKSLHFLINKTFLGDIYVPIGQRNWYFKRKRRSNFDQQPEDPATMVLALVAVAEILQNNGYKELAYKCFTWFLGNNIVGKPLYNHKEGSVFDGLRPFSVNENRGAESLVSYLLARLSLN